MASRRADSVRRSPTPLEEAGRLGGLRAQSEVIGTVLILGMVITSAGLIALAGASVMDQYRELAGQESTANAMEEIDTRFSSVASVGGLTRTEFSLGDAKPSKYRIVRSGHINVTANRNPSCRAHIPLSSLRYERDDGVLIALEAGGIWRQEQGVLSQTVVHTPPDVTFENGTLSVSVVDISGSVDGSQNLVFENISRSIQTNQELEDAMFQDGCARPDNVTVSVQSDFFRGWSRYLQGSIEGSSYDTFDSNRTTRVFLAQENLPTETNDSRNDVVDLTSEEYNNINISSDSIEVTKGANNTYTTIVTPLSTGSTQVGKIREVEDDQAYRPPLDVIFVFDESGSMQWEADDDGVDEWGCYSDPGCNSKTEEAQKAAKSFVGQMNASFDRAGAVSFENDARYLYNRSGSPRHHVYLSADFESVNASIDTLDPDGGTESAKGLYKANTVLGLKSNSSRKKVIVLLSDGVDDGGAPDPVLAAEEADKEGITIHAIGFGEPDNSTLEEVASTTGGSYRYVSDANDLDDAFDDLFAEISESRQIARDPLSLQLNASGTAFQPQIDGDTSHIARGQGGELNLNDPTAPTGFSYSIDVSDGENITMTAVDYDCLDWARTGNVYENESTGFEYEEVRCVKLDNSSRDEILPSKTNVSVDGTNVSGLLNEPGDWWNTDLKNETLAPYLTGPNNETLDLETNQALVVFEFDDGDGGTDRLLVLFQIGQSEEESVPKHVFNLEVRHLVIGQDD